MEGRRIHRGHYVGGKCTTEGEKGNGTSGGEQERAKQSSQQLFGTQWSKKKGFMITMGGTFGTTGSKRSPGDDQRRIGGGNVKQESEHATYVDPS